MAKTWWMSLMFWNFVYRLMRRIREKAASVLQRSPISYVASYLWTKNVRPASWYKMQTKDNWIFTRHWQTLASMYAAQVSGLSGHCLLPRLSWKIYILFFIFAREVTHNHKTRWVPPKKKLFVVLRKTKFNISIRTHNAYILIGEASYMKITAPKKTVPQLM
jgi:hypothetical protein